MLWTRGRNTEHEKLDSKLKKKEEGELEFSSWANFMYENQWVRASLQTGAKSIH